jgi:hypothetical protein
LLGHCFEEKGEEGVFVGGKKVFFSRLENKVYTFRCFPLFTGYFGYDKAGVDYLHIAERPIYPKKHKSKFSIAEIEARKMKEVSSHCKHLSFSFQTKKSIFLSKNSFASMQTKNYRPPQTTSQQVINPKNYYRLKAKGLVGFCGAASRL